MLGDVRTGLSIPAVVFLLLYQPQHWGGGLVRLVQIVRVEAWNTTVSCRQPSTATPAAGFREYFLGFYGGEGVFTVHLGSFQPPTPREGSKAVVAFQPL